ncbi:MAG: hypothetical protein R3C62_05240 [Chloroflexota bacterium]
MKKQENPPVQFAICINNDGYPASLERHKVYRVLPDNDAATEGDLRVIDESGEDYLYPAHYFLLIQLAEDTKTALSHSFAHLTA